MAFIHRHCPIIGGSDGTYKVAAAITQFAGGSKKYLGTNHAELA